MKTLTASLSAALLTLSGLAATHVHGAEYTLRCQHFTPAKSATPSRFMQPWADKIMAETEGRLKIEIYPLMQLGGKPPGIYDQIKDGVIDCGWALPAYTPGRFPSTEAIEQPFVSSTSAEETSKAAWDYIQKHGQEELSDVHLIAVHVHGAGVIHKKGAPVESMEDMQGLKLRGPSRAANKLLESMGATAVGMPVPTFPEALSKGVVDGGVIPEEIVVPLKVHELADSHTYFAGNRALYNTFFIWAMNKDSYANLPEDIRAVIDANSGLEASAWAGRAMDEGDAASSKIIHATDNAIVTLSAEETARWKAKAEAQVKEWAMNTENGEQRLADAIALVEQYSGPAQ